MTNTEKLRAASFLMLKTAGTDRQNVDPAIAALLGGFTGPFSGIYAGSKTGDSGAGWGHAGGNIAASIGGHAVGGVLGQMGAGALSSYLMAKSHNKKTQEELGPLQKLIQAIKK